MAEWNIDDHIVDILRDEPYFAALSRQINKTESTAIPTAGVSFKAKHLNFELIYNPEWLSSLTKAQAKSVLIHEFMHLSLNHITKRRPDNPKDAKLWNIACDLAINSHLPDLPEEGCFPGKNQFKDFKPGLSAEVYMQELLKDREKYCGKEVTILMSHDGWEVYDEDGNKLADSGTGTDEIMDKCIKDMVNNAVKAVTGKGMSWGNHSEKIQKEILELLESKIDWRAVLRSFIFASRRAHKRSSVKRINKRYPYIQPGRLTNRVANVAVSIDQSGSVDDGLLTEFFSELAGLAKIVSFTVVPFDHAVIEDEVYEWKKGSVRKVERVACGGTDFDAPVAYVDERSFDGHIILTDLCAPVPKPSKVQRIWFTNKECIEHYAGPFTKERVYAIE